MNMSNKAIYEVITKRVVEEIQNAIKTGETFHWIKSWKGIPTGNAISFLGKNFTPYRGINRLLVSPGLHITFTQLQEFQKKHPEVEFKIKKGCHTETVYFYKMNELKDTDEDGEEIVRTIPLMRFYKVFNINNIENLPEFFKVEEKEHTLTDPMKKAEEIVANYCDRDGLKLEIVDGSDRCFYRPSAHMVNVPKISQFDSPEEYYGALFHELVHSTSKFLGRDAANYFGSKDYSFEELIAEIGSAMICDTLGITNEKAFSNSVAYLQGWLSKLDSEDVSFIVKAANAAQRACDYILNVEYDNQEESKTA